MCEIAIFFIYDRSCQKTLRIDEGDRIWNFKFWKKNYGDGDSSNTVEKYCFSEIDRNNSYGHFKLSYVYFGWK